MVALVFPETGTQFNKVALLAFPARFKYCEVANGACTPLNKGTRTLGMGISESEKVPPNGAREVILIRLLPSFQ